MNPPTPLRVTVASPCKASWAQMQGDDRVRFCAACRKNVYNLSALPQAEAEALLRREGGPPCVTFFKRADGTVLTQDCPVGRVERLRRRAAAALVAAASFAVAACRGSAPAASTSAQQPPAAHGADPAFAPDAGTAGIPQGAVPTTGEPMPLTPPPPPPPAKAAKRSR